MKTPVRIFRQQTRRSLFVYLTAFVFVFSLFSNPIVLAVDGYDATFYETNEILYYNPEATKCSNQSVSSGGTPGENSANLETILRYYTSKGLSLAAAAGIAGNMKFESGFNPAIIQGGDIAPDNYAPVNSVGFGLVQWTWTSRQAPLVALANSTNRNITDINLQLDYTWQELINGYKSSTLLPISTITDPIEAAIHFHTYYEGSADTPEVVRAHRGQAASDIYNNYRATIQDGTGVPELAGESATAATFGASGCSNLATPAADASKPENVLDKGTGWTLKDNTDYSSVPCVNGSLDTGIVQHPEKGFTYRICAIEGTSVVVNSLISARTAAMIAAAKAEGITLNGGGVRTYEEQVALRKKNCGSGWATVSSMQCSPPTGKPGESQHERGLAVDFGNAAVGGAVNNWLKANGAKYGYINWEVESWHWSMSGY